MTQEELIEIGTKICNIVGTEDEIDNLMDLFDRKVPHPNGSNLFFYLESYNARKHNLGDYNPTIEKIVDKCISYKPIKL